MALIVKTFHEYHNCSNQWQYGRCERPAEGWVCVVTAERVEFAQPHCLGCGLHGVGSSNRFEALMERERTWMFVPAAWQVDILTRNKYACLYNSLAAQGIVAQPQADALPWPVAA